MPTGASPISTITCSNARAARKSATLRNGSTDGHARCSNRGTQCSVIGAKAWAPEFGVTGLRFCRQAGYRLGVRVRTEANPRNDGELPHRSACAATISVLC